MDPQHGLEVEATEAWTEEQSLLVQLVHDVLAVEGGPDFHVIDDPLEMRGVPGDTLCIFLIETNPDLNLSVSIEIGDRAMRLRVNGVPYAFPRKPGHDAVRWIDRCCRNVERLVASPDLKVTREHAFGLTSSTALHVNSWSRRRSGRTKKWRKIGEKTVVLGVVTAALVHLLPFAILLDQEDERVYENWYGQSPPPDEADEQPEPVPQA